MDWHIRAKELHAEYGNSWGKIAEVLSDEFGEEFKYERVRRWFRDNCPEIKEKTKKEPQDLMEILSRPHDLRELVKKSGLSQRMVLAQIEDYRDAGYHIEEINGKYFIATTTDQSQNEHTLSWKGEREIIFGLVSDTHLASKSQQLTYLNDFYDKCVEYGVKDVFHAGDWVDGMDVYPGQIYHLLAIGNDAQKDYAVKNYPKRKGIITHGISGNHDLKTFAKTGYDIVKAIANERDDIDYLGQYFARVNLTPNCVLQICHPMGKQAYSLSYKLQRKIDTLSGGDKPAIIAEGHFHSSCWFFRRNVQALMLPSFQGPNDLSRRLGLECDIGGVIVTVKVDSEGTIREFTPKFFPYLKPIENDY